jgi:hypothetical protein
MLVLGIDFTSNPKPRKPITCLACVLDHGVLRPDYMQTLNNFHEFADALASAGPWMAGLDFPFGQSRKFIEGVGWPHGWLDYVSHANSLGREGFRLCLQTYCAGRPSGDKEHRRKTDIAAGAVSPQKLYYPPVGLMFFEGAPRLIDAGVTIPGLQAGDMNRIAVEAYPGIVARKLIGRRSYKSDSKGKQTEDQRIARYELLDRINAGGVAEYGFQVQAFSSLADDPTGDQLDALLCAIQAAWSWTQRENGFGVPDDCDYAEGWIADPTLCKRT